MVVVLCWYGEFIALHLHCIRVFFGLQISEYHQLTHPSIEQAQTWSNGWEEATLSAGEAGGRGDKSDDCSWLMMWDETKLDKTILQITYYTSCDKLHNKTANQPHSNNLLFGWATRRNMEQNSAIWRWIFFSFLIFQIKLGQLAVKFKTTNGF